MKNRFGFTLIELLVAVVILGIITGMSVPLIRNIRAKNEQKKYDNYGISMLSSAKMYRDSYENDLFGYRASGCAIVSFQELKEKGLIKDFPDANVSCNNENSVVRIIKLDKKYGYSYQLYCGIKNSDGTISHIELKSSSYSKIVNSAQATETDGNDFDNDGFNDKICNPVSDIFISASPDKDLTTKESHNITLKVSSMTGIQLGSKLQYAWVEVDNKDGNYSIDYNTITDWKNWTFHLMGEAKQKEQLLMSTANPIEVSKIITTPVSAPAYYLLLLKVSNVKDLYGEAWKEKDNPSIYKKIGVFNVAKKYSLRYNSQGGSSCSNLYKFHEKNGNETWGELCNPTRNSYDFLGWNTKADGSGVDITANTKVTSDLVVYAKWKKKRIYKNYLKNASFRICPADKSAQGRPTNTTDECVLMGWGNKVNYMELTSLSIEGDWASLKMKLVSNSKYPNGVDCGGAVGEICLQQGDNGGSRCDKLLWGNINLSNTWSKPGNYWTHDPYPININLNELSPGLYRVIFRTSNNSCNHLTFTARNDWNRNRFIFEIVNN